MEYMVGHRRSLARLALELEPKWPQLKPVALAAHPASLLKAQAFPSLSSLDSLDQWDLWDLGH